MNFVYDLLKNKGILVNGIIVYPVEVEFYYHDNKHPDPFVHCNQDQSKFGYWYFHRHKTGTYKNGTFKGLDLTIGNNGSYGGILIRSIRVDNTIIEGPCKCVNFILEAYKVNSIAEFVGEHLLYVANNHRNFHLINVPEFNIKILRGPRIGLKSKDESVIYNTYIGCLYRFVSDNRVKKAKLSLITD